MHINSFNLPQLRKTAAHYGISIKGIRKKADVISALTPYTGNRLHFNDVNIPLSALGEDEVRRRMYNISEPDIIDGKKLIDRCTDEELENIRDKYDLYHIDFGMRTTTFLRLWLGDRVDPTPEPEYPISIADDSVEVSPNNPNPRPHEITDPNFIPAGIITSPPPDTIATIRYRRPVRRNYDINNYTDEIILRILRHKITNFSAFSIQERRHLFDVFVSNNYMNVVLDTSTSSHNSLYSQLYEPPFILNDTLNISEEIINNYDIFGEYDSILNSHLTVDTDLDAYPLIRTIANDNNLSRLIPNFRKQLFFHGEVYITLSQYQLIQNTILPQFYDNSFYRGLIVIIYGSEAAENRGAHISPLEKSFFGVHDDSFEELKAAPLRVGMLTTPVVDNNVTTLKRYILNNISLYRNVRPDGQTSAEMPDQTLLNRYQIRIDFTNRTDLLATLDSFKNDPNFKTFFLPMSPYYRERSRNIAIVGNNKTTTMGNPVLEEMVEGNAVAFGNFNTNYIFSFDELNALWGTMNRPLYPSPENYDMSTGQGSFFPKVRVENHLVKLLKMYPQPATEEKISLLSTIETVKELGNLSVETTAIRYYRNLSSVEKSKVDSFMRETINAGWRMRQWLGPGNAYPITGNTRALYNQYRNLPLKRRREIDALASAGNISSEDAYVFTFVEPHLSAVELLYNSMEPETKELMNNLETFNVNLPNDEPPIVPTQQNFMDYFRGVQRGTTCIRMASSKFIATGVRFVNVFANEPVEYDISNMSRIQ